MTKRQMCAAAGTLSFVALLLGGCVFAEPPSFVRFSRPGPANEASAGQGGGRVAVQHLAGTNPGHLAGAGERPYAICVVGACG